MSRTTVCLADRHRRGRARRSRLAIVCALLVADGAASGQTADPPAGKPPPLIELMDYYVRDGGTWLAENPDYEPGSSGDTRYGYDFRWMFDRAAVRLVIFGLNAQGQRTDYHECIYVWNPVEERIQMFQFTFFGGFGGGLEQQLDGGSSEIVISWLLPNGKTYVFKDAAMRRGDDEFENRSYEKDEHGNWQQKGGFLWRRQRT